MAHRPIRRKSVINSLSCSLNVYLQILVEMQLLTSCREEDFITNWRESKERLLTNVSTFPEQAEAGEQCEIPGNFISKLTLIHNNMYS